MATSPLDLDRLTSSDLALRVAMGIGRMTPPALGARLAKGAASVLAAQRSTSLIRALRANQWVVSGAALSGEALDETVHANLRQMARSLYDLYHLAENPAELQRIVEFSDAAATWIERSNRESVVIAVLHLSSFDLAGRALALRGLRAQLLSIPQPADVHAAENELRRRAGLDITPISLASLRRAAERLASDGSVLTGIDRPIDSTHTLRFFGRPAHLPDLHVRLAQRFGVPLVLLWVQSYEGKYRLDAQPVELEAGTSSRITTANAERVLSAAEPIIAARPADWAMPHTVWPDAAAELTELENLRS